MPYRRRIVSVSEWTQCSDPRNKLMVDDDWMFRAVGRPINVVKNEKPTLEEVHAVQKLYIEELYR